MTFLYPARGRSSAVSPLERAALAPSVLVQSYRALVALVGSYSTTRMRQGRYTVVRSLEHGACLPGDMPLLETLDVVCAPLPLNRGDIALLEVYRAHTSLLGETLHAPTVASRHYCAAWPDALKCGYRACLMAFAAWCASNDANMLELAARGHIAKRTPSTEAYTAWLAVERHWLPLFIAWESENGLATLELAAPLAPVTAQEG